MIVIHRPVIHDDQLDSPFTAQALFTASEPVDVDLLWDSFRRYFVEINGNLHACNFDLAGAVNNNRLVIEETQVLFPEFYQGDRGHEIPTVGHTHSHDGIDSSYLGMGAVDRSNTKHRAFGAFMCGSDSRQVWLFHGSVPLQEKTFLGSVDATGFLTFYIDIPYPAGRVEGVWHQDLNTANEGSTLKYYVPARCFGTLRCFDPALFGKVALIGLNAKVVMVDRIRGTLLEAKVAFNDVAYDVEVDGQLGLDWMIWAVLRSDDNA